MIDGIHVNNIHWQIEDIQDVTAGCDLIAFQLDQHEILSTQVQAFCTTWSRLARSDQLTFDEVIEKSHYALAYLGVMSWMNAQKLGIRTQVKREKMGV